MAALDADDDDSQEVTDSESGMTFLDHLEDVRKVAFRCAIALAVGVGLVGVFLSQFSKALIHPLNVALGGQSEASVQGLITTGPMGVFSVMIQVCFLGGFFLALPAMLYFIAGFIAPALTPQEKKSLIPACVASAVLFLLGALFSYFLLVPASLKASKYFNDMLGFATIWRADSYYGLLVWMVLGIGASFQFPLLVVSMVKLNIVSIAQLKAFRPYSIVLFLILSAVITPTADPFTFLLLAVPMMLFYEASIWFCKRKG